MTDLSELCICAHMRLSHDRNGCYLCKCPGWATRPAPRHAGHAGRKDDTGKARWSLLLSRSIGRAVDMVVDVLVIGADRYGAWNWEQVENWRERYMDALIRHLRAYERGEKADSGSGKHPLAHVVCCALFMLAKEIA